MVTTTRGTSYSPVTFEVLGRELATFAIADAVVGTPQVPLLVYAHGNTGLHDQFTSGSMWRRLREVLIDEGWAYVESAGGGPSSWGNQASRDSYEAAVSYLDDTMDVGTIAVLGRSMGGLVGAWLATQSPVVAHRCAGIIFNSAVADLRSERWHDLIAAAHGVDDDDDDEKYFASVTAPYDPMQFPLSHWEGRSAQWVVGTADTLVPPAANGLALRNRVLENLAVAELVVVEGADHSPAGGTYNEIDPMMNFLKAARLRSGAAER